MKSSTLLNVAKTAAIVGVGFVAVKAAFAAKEKIDAGVKAGAAVVEAVKEVVTKDLNPASTENLAYKGVNSVAQYATNDPSWNLGAKLFEWLNPDKVRSEKELLSAAPSNTQVQTQFIGLAPSIYREQELNAQDEAAIAAVIEADKKMSNARSTFRASEITQQNEAAKGGFLGFNF